MRRQDQVPWMDKHLLTGHIRREPLVEIRYTELPVEHQYGNDSLTRVMKQISRHMGQ
jgi:hypothetical protein